MQIALRRGDISVTKNIFYDVDVDAARVQPRPQGVTKIMEEFYHYIVHENGNLDDDAPPLLRMASASSTASQSPFSWTM